MNQLTVMLNGNASFAQQHPTAATTSQPNGQPSHQFFTFQTTNPGHPIQMDPNQQQQSQQTQQPHQQQLVTFQTTTPGAAAAGTPIMLAANNPGFNPSFQPGIGQGAIQYIITPQQNPNHPQQQQQQQIHISHAAVANQPQHHLQQQPQTFSFMPTNNLISSPGTQINMIPINPVNGTTTTTNLPTGATILQPHLITNNVSTTLQPTAFITNPHQPTATASITPQFFHQPTAATATPTGQPTFQMIGTTHPNSNGAIMCNPNQLIGTTASGQQFILNPPPQQQQQQLLQHPFPQQQLTTTTTQPIYQLMLPNGQIIHTMQQQPTTPQQSMTANLLSSPTTTLISSPNASNPHLQQQQPTAITVPIHPQNHHQSNTTILAPNHITFNPGGGGAGHQATFLTTTQVPHQQQQHQATIIASPPINVFNTSSSTSSISGANSSNHSNQQNYLNNNSQNILMTTTTTTATNSIKTTTSNSTTAMMVLTQSTLSSNTTGDHLNNSSKSTSLIPNVLLDHKSTKSIISSKKNDVANSNSSVGGSGGANNFPLNVNSIGSQTTPSQEINLLSEKINLASATTTPTPESSQQFNNKINDNEIINQDKFLNEKQAPSIVDKENSVLEKEYFQESVQCVDKTTSPINPSVNISRPSSASSYGSLKIAEESSITEDAQVGGEDDDDANTIEEKEDNLKDINNDNASTETEIDTVDDSTATEINTDCGDSNKPNDEDDDVDDGQNCDERQDIGSKITMKATLELTNNVAVEQQLRLSTKNKNNKGEEKEGYQSSYGGSPCHFTDTEDEEEDDGDLEELNENGEIKLIRRNGLTQAAFNLINNRILSSEEDNATTTSIDSKCSSASTSIVNEELCSIHEKKINHNNNSNNNTNENINGDDKTNLVGNNNNNQQVKENIDHPTSKVSIQIQTSATPSPSLSTYSNHSSINNYMESPSSSTESTTQNTLISSYTEKTIWSPEEQKLVQEIQEFAKTFKLRRLSLGLTQAQVGQELSALGPCYSQSAICRFEKLDITLKSAKKIKPILENWMREAEEKHRDNKIVGCYINPDDLVKGLMMATNGKDGPNVNGSTFKISSALELVSKNQLQQQQQLNSNNGDENNKTKSKEKNGSIENGLSNLTSNSNVNMLKALMNSNKKRKRRTSFTPAAIDALNNYFELNNHPNGAEMTKISESLNYHRDVVRVWFCNKRQATKAKNVKNSSDPISSSTQDQNCDSNSKDNMISDSMLIDSDEKPSKPDNNNNGIIDTSNIKTEAMSPPPPPPSTVTVPLLSAFSAFHIPNNTTTSTTTPLPLRPPSLPIPSSTVRNLNIPHGQFFNPIPPPPSLIQQQSIKRPIPNDNGLLSMASMMGPFNFGSTLSSSSFYQKNDKDSKSNNNNNNKSFDALIKQSNHQSIDNNTASAAVN